MSCKHKLPCGIYKPSRNAKMLVCTTTMMMAVMLQFPFLKSAGGRGAPLMLSLDLYAFSWPFASSAPFSAYQYLESHDFTLLMITLFCPQCVCTFTMVKYKSLAPLKMIFISYICNVMLNSLQNFKCQHIYIAQ